MVDGDMIPLGLNIKIHYLTWIRLCFADEADQDGWKKLGTLLALNGKRNLTQNTMIALIDSQLKLKATTPLINTTGKTPQKKKLSIDQFEQSSSSKKPEIKLKTRPGDPHDQFQMFHTTILHFSRFVITIFMAKVNVF